MKLSFASRVPSVRRGVSDRVMWMGIGVFVLFVGAVTYGLIHRIRIQQARAEQQQYAATSSEPAVSNRSQLENQHGTMARPTTPTPTPTTAPAPAAPPTPPASLRPLYTQATSVSRHDMLEQLLAAQRGREAQREQEAIAAPTGVHESTPPVIGTPAAMGAPAPGALSNEGSVTHEQVQNALEEKRRFAAPNDTSGDDYQTSTRTAPVTRWVIQRGTVIPATLPSKLVSDLPGDLVGVVARDVHDSPTGNYVLIPAGSRLVGEYNSHVTYAQNRVQVAWTAVYFPDGSYLDLSRMPSHDADGSVGMHDQTDNHYKRLIAGVALSSLLAAGLQISQNRTNGSVLQYPNTGQEIAAAVGTQATEAGTQITNRNLNIPPTLKIRPGELFAVFVSKDIVFSGPYTPMDVK